MTALSAQPSTLLPTAPGAVAASDLLLRLENMGARRGMGGLALRLGDLAAFIAQDMAVFAEEFAVLPLKESRVQASALHLLDHGGKRLRPMCVALASRLGTGFSAQALDLAVAVELVHSATLLHDDVVDLSETRRGQPTSRVVYGNAVAIFGGDLLLIEALRRVQRCKLPGVLEHLLDTIDEMIAAESLQLQNRGRIDLDREVYFQVTTGKTAALFRWAMAAGGQAAGLSSAERRALQDYGFHLGIAFQATDDLLDLNGDVGRTGKELFADLREGKMTFPVIVALEREPRLRTLIEEILELPLDRPLSRAAASEVVQTLQRTRAVDDCLDLARSHAERAIASLEQLPAGEARSALTTVALAIVDRDL